ncbi:MAG: hypothetical protein V3V20_03465 [Algisphaera sp.]
MSQPFPSDQDTSQSTNQASRLWTAAPRAALFISADHAALLAAAVAQAWLMVFLALGVEAPAHRNPALESLGLPLSLLASAGAALGLAGFAVALHDVLDRRHDRVVATSDKVRPVASGQVAPRAAAAAGIYALLGGLLAAGFLGPASLRVALAVAAGILFYNFAGRFIPSIAVLLPALLHALAMGVPNPKAAFLWPLVLTFTHVAVAQWWIWRRGRGIQGKPGIHLPAVGMGWGFWCLLLLFIADRRSNLASSTASAIVGPTGGALVGPSVALAVFVIVALRLPQGSARSLRPLANAWLVLYAGLWLLACNQMLGVLAMAPLLIVAAAAAALNRRTQSPL